MAYDNGQKGIVELIEGRVDRFLHTLGDKVVEYQVGKELELELRAAIRARGSITPPIIQSDMDGLRFFWYGMVDRLLPDKYKKEKS